MHKEEQDFYAITMKQRWGPSLNTINQPATEQNNNNSAATSAQQPNDV